MYLYTIEVNESHEGMRKCESLWPVHQINWQRTFRSFHSLSLSCVWIMMFSFFLSIYLSIYVFQCRRYVYDMYYTYHRISRDVYDYCVRNKIIDAALAAKWKKSGYEKLCSTYVINPRNYRFGTVSICRVPKQFLPPGTIVEDPFSGCRFSFLFIVLLYISYFLYTTLYYTISYHIISYHIII